MPERSCSMFLPAGNHSLKHNPRCYALSSKTGLSDSCNDRLSLMSWDKEEHWIKPSYLVMTNYVTDQLRRLSASDRDRIHPKDSVLCTDMIASTI